METIDVAPLLDDVVSTMTPIISKTGNQLAFSPPAHLARVCADATKLRQVLLHLLTNAIKFTEHGTIRLIVEQANRDDRSGIAFHIQDTGIGMTDAQLANIFQDFTQADPSATRKYGGTGLGLSLSRRLCQMMDGEISVLSVPECGSTFTVWLPAATAEPMYHTAINEVTLVISAEMHPYDPLTRMLHEEHYYVLTARSGVEGLRLAHQLHPDIIILDVDLPDMDSWILLNTIKDDSLISGIPVIMTMGIAAPPVEHRATACLAKPIDRDRLLIALAPHRLSTMVA